MTTNKKPVWMRFESAAQQLGLTRDLMRAAIERGEIPIRMTRFGARSLIYVCRVDFDQYVKECEATP